MSTLKKQLIIMQCVDLKGRLISTTSQFLNDTAKVFQYEDFIYLF